MSTRLSRYISASCVRLLVCVALGLVAAMPLWAQAPLSSAEQPTASSPPGSADVSAAAGKAGAADSEAEQHFRKGVDLYNNNLYLEALNEFNRALALDPQIENAKIYREKCNGKLQIGAAGGDPTAVPTFETVEPGAMPTTPETPQLSAEEMKIKRVGELLERGERLLENLRYSRAVKVFEEVLLIAPENARAREGLHKATIGASKEAATEAEGKVEEDKATIIRYIEDSKRLPAGANATGIKPYRITIPVIEEQYVEPKKRSDIEQILDSPVGIEFEGVHLSEIVEFISDSWDINIVIDDRVVKRPPKPAPAPTAAPPPTAGTPYPMYGVPPTGAAPGGLNIRPTTTPGGLQPRPYGLIAPTTLGVATTTAGTAGYAGEYVTDGIIPYINLKDVPLREALKALLRPLNLDFAIQPGFIWISTPQKIREESFEELETRYYELRNAGAETLFKIVLRNPGGGGGGMMGGYGGYGGGGYGGGGYGGYGGGGLGGYGGGGYGGGGLGGYGGGGYGGYGGGGYGGGGYGGYGGGGLGGYGGGGLGGYGGGGYGGGGYGGGGYGGYGGGGYGGGGYGGGGYGGGRYGGGYGGGGMMGGYGGGGYGGGGGVQIQNISQLFGSISDAMVGETPAIIGTAGLTTGGTGQLGGARVGGVYGAGLAAGTQQGAGLGATAGRAQAVQGDEPEIVRLLRLLVNDVYEPGGTDPISRMIYVPHTNQLIVHNTPTNLANLEKQLAELDITPKQVSIEAKFLTIKATDLNKMGFKWNSTKSDQNSRAQQMPELAGATYDYDINGDGVAEQIPFYKRPNGASVIANTITKGVLDAVTSPGPPGSFSISGIITDNADGDKLSVVFDYLNSLQESELLSAPRVTTMNRKPAVIADLSTEYFVSSVYTDVIAAEAGFGGTAALGYTQSVTPQPFNFGITLSVTPQISGGDQVRLWLNPQVTTRGIEKSFTQKSIINGEEITSTITLPNTTTQAVWTNVVVHDGDTLVLGGLVSDQTIKGREKMPYLADIPILGFFFRGKSKQANQSSLLIFVTPSIIDTTGARFFEVGTMAPRTPEKTGTVRPSAEEAAGRATPSEGKAVEAAPAPAEEPASKS